MLKFDVVVIGDGVFGNVFLYELNKIVNNSQNFSVAHIYSDHLAPACATRSTSTVSLNGIEEGISELGNDLFNAFNSFKDFFESENTPGIFPVKQIISSDIPDKLDKLKLRYRGQIKNINSPYLKNNNEGVELESFIVIPELFLQELKSKKKIFEYQKIDDVVIGIEENDDGVTLKLKNSNTIYANKVVMATGAYSRLFTQLFENTIFNEKIFLTKIVAGSFLIKKFDHHENLYLTLNGHNLVYRKETRELIIGSTTVQGAITMPNLIELMEIFEEIKKLVSIDLGEFRDYKIITGLRHKGQKRMPFFKPISESSKIWFFNGAYKNGWSLPFYYVKRDIKHFCK